MKMYIGVMLLNITLDVELSDTVENLKSSFPPHMANKSESPFLQSVSYFWQVSIEIYLGDMSCPWYI